MTTVNRTRARTALVSSGEQRAVHSTRWCKEILARGATQLFCYFGRCSCRAIACSRALHRLTHSRYGKANFPPAHHEKRASAQHLEAWPNAYWRSLLPPPAALRQCGTCNEFACSQISELRPSGCDGRPNRTSGSRNCNPLDAAIALTVPLSRVTLP